MKCFKSRKTFCIAAFLFLCLFSLVFPKIFDEKPKSRFYERPSYPLEVFIIDVKEGSSCLIKYGGRNILIDAGSNDDGKEIKEFLEKENVKRLDMAAVTHLHSDHYGGLLKVLNNFEVKRVVFPKFYSWEMPKDNTFKEILNYISENSVSLTYLAEKETFYLGRAKLVALGPFLKERKNINDSSLNFKLEFKDAQFFIGGDGEKETEEALLNENIMSDIYAANHHGSKTSSGKEFLKKVNPKVSVISAGRNNKNNFPCREVLKRLSSYGPYFVTGKDGSLLLATDGEVMEIYTQKEGKVLRLSLKEA